MTRPFENILQFVQSNKPGKDDEYENLAIAIVLSACEDYGRLFFEAEHCYNNRDKLNLILAMKDIEHFFHSEWGDILCFGHADFIWSCLQKEYQWTS